MNARQRKQANSALRNTKNMPRKLEATQGVLSGMPEMAGEYGRQMECSTHRPCGASICPHCAHGVPFRPAPKTGQAPSLTPVKADTSTARGKSRNYRSRGGCWMTAPFAGHDDDRLVAFTLHISLEPMGFDAAKAVIRERAKLRKVLAACMPGAVLRMIFDIDPRLARGTCRGYPDSAIHPSLRGDPRPDVPAYLLHAHGIIYHPSLSQDEVRKLINRHYPGANRACISRKVAPFADPDGHVRGGLEGWGEYAAMEKIVVDFPDGDERYDNVAVAEDMIRIRSNWSRQARRMSYGVRTNRDAVPEVHVGFDKLSKVIMVNLDDVTGVTDIPDPSDVSFHSIDPSITHLDFDSVCINKGDGESVCDRSLNSLDLSEFRVSYLRGICADHRQRRVR